MIVLRKKQRGDMRQKFIKKPLLAIAMVSSLVLSTFGHPAFAAALTISEDGPNVAIDQNVSVTAAEWSLETQATPEVNANGTPANVSLIFGYTDQNNYYYANYSTADADNLSGVYKVTAGMPSKLLGYANRVTAGQTYNLEVRMKSGAAKLYMNNTYLTKVTTVTLPASNVGVGTVHGNATFDGTTLNDGTTHALTPTLVGATVPPTDPGDGGGSTPPTDPGMPPPPWGYQRDGRPWNWPITVNVRSRTGHRSTLADNQAEGPGPCGGSGPLVTGHRRLRPR